MSAKTWSQFSTTRKCDETILKFRIQEATEYNHADVLNFMEKYYIDSETFNKSAEIYKSKAAIREMFSLYNLTGPDKLTLICYHDNGSNTASPIVGISMATLETISDEDKLTDVISEVKTPEVKKLLNVIRALKELAGGMKTLGVEKWYNVNRICVHPDYTGLGIAREFLKVWRVICKELKVSAASAWMTAIGTQKAAERDGWQTYYEKSFDELGRHFECEFSDVPPTFKAMIASADK